MEKETTSELIYENLLQRKFYKNLIIDPSVNLPHDFPNIKKYIKHLGEGALALYENDFTFDVLYPGGMVTYCSYKETDTLLIDRIVIYGITTEPGVRALGTSKFDTHIYFDLEKSDNSELTPEEKKNYFNLEDTQRIKMTVKEPEDSNIKDWWTK